MNNGVTFAQQYQLRPGISLSAAQMAQLTSDIVWLVERDVTLPDGTVTKALVPQVYVRVKDGDLTGDGALISADAVNFNMTGDLTNSGTIAGRTAVVLNAQNIHNLAGRIRGADVTVAATNDLHNTGGQIIATDSLIATAGRDLNITSTTRTQTGSTGSRTNINRVAGLYASNPGGTLVASAGRDANIIAGVISNAGAGGSTVIAAGRDLNLGTVTEASSNAIAWSANNFRKDSQSQEVGSNILTAGNLQLSAGNDLNARAAQLTSSQGALTVSAANNVNITAGQSSQAVDEGHQSKSKGFLSSKTITTRETLDRTDAVGSSLSGNTVTVLAGQNINVKALARCLHIVIQLLGGRLFRHSMVAMGAELMEQLSRLRADVFFMGATGVHASTGVTTGDSEEAAVKRALHRCASETVLLTSSEKLGAASSCRIMALADVSAVVVHRGTPAPWIRSAKRAGVRVVLAG